MSKTQIGGTETWRKRAAEFLTEHKGDKSNATADLADALKAAHEGINWLEVAEQLIDSLEVYP
jgi:hypothetical protein